MPGEAMITAGQAVVSFLESRGVDRVFCLPGESFLPVLDALIDSPIDTVTCLHESSAGFMALADGRLTGRPGICMVSRGPGATNAAIAIHTADQDGVPMIVLVGQVPRRNLRRGAFQEIDYARMYGTMARHVVEVGDPGRLPEALARAWHAALDRTPGPVVVALPEDLLEEMVEPVEVPPYRPTRTAVDPEAVEQAAAILERASRPVIVAGGALASEAGRATLLRVAETRSLPVIVSFRRHDLFPNDHPLFAGELGVFNSAEQTAAFEESDAILAVGTRLGDLTTHGYTFPHIPWPRQRLVHVYDDPAVIGRWFEPELGLACPPVAFLQALAARPAPSASAGRDAWARRLAGIRAGLGTWAPRTAPDGVVFGNVIAALHARARPDELIVPDAGISAALIYRYFPFRPPQRLLATVTGVMGFGMPGSIVAALRHPGRRVVCLVGDGGFLMTGNELALTVERRLPILVILSNNGSLGTIRANQERMFPGRPVATRLATPDFQTLARAFGCPGFLIEREADVGPVLDRAFAALDGPVLVEVRSSIEAILPARS